MQLTGAVKSHGHSYSVTDAWGVLSYIAQWCAAPTLPKPVELQTTIFIFCSSHDQIVGMIYTQPEQPMGRKVNK